MLQTFCSCSNFASMEIFWLCTIVTNDAIKFSQLLVGSIKLNYNNTNLRLIIPKDLEGNLVFKQIDKTKYKLVYPVIAFMLHYVWWHCSLQLDGTIRPSWHSMNHKLMPKKDLEGNMVYKLIDKMR